MTGDKKRRGVEMKISKAMTSILLFVFAAQVFGLAYGTEKAAANDSMNATQINETTNNTTITNETLSNDTLENITLINGTLENVSLSQNDSDPFTNAKNRKPSSR
jgi:hypothetical protein